MVQKYKWSMRDYSGLRDDLYTKNDYSIVVLILEKQTDNSNLSKLFHNSGTEHFCSVLFYFPGQNIERKTFLAHGVSYAMRIDKSAKLRYNFNVG